MVLRTQWHFVAESMWLKFIIAFSVYFVVLGAGVPDAGVGMQDLESPTEESQQLRHRFEGR